MEIDRKIHIVESAPMNGGEGPYSYAQNSTYQKGVAVAAMNVIKEALPTALDLNLLASSSPNPIIRIADFGCSTGFNSIQVIETMIQCLLERIKPIKETQFPSLELQVIFNDLPTNDFNTLFANLPLERQHYYAAAALGSFYSRVLPRASVHVAHSSYSLHFLSRAPLGISDATSRNWNGERIHYSSSPKEVVGAYTAQFKSDMEAFLSARAEEVVGGGLVFLVVPGVPDLLLDSQTTWASEIELLGSCLVDMANEGVISKAKIESFNVPIYFPSGKELKQVIDRNGSFDIERIQILDHPKIHVAFSTAKSRCLFLRAIIEGLLVSHFGEELMNDLFRRYLFKVAKSPFFLKPQNHEAITFFAVLKRKMY